MTIKVPNIYRKFNAWRVLRVTKYKYMNNIVGIYPFFCTTQRATKLSFASSTYLNHPDWIIACARIFLYSRPSSPRLPRAFPSSYSNRLISSILSSRRGKWARNPAGREKRNRKKRRERIAAPEKMAPFGAKGFHDTRFSDWFFSLKPRNSEAESHTVSMYIQYCEKSMKVSILVQLSIFIQRERRDIFIYIYVCRKFKFEKIFFCKDIFTSSFMQ